MRRRVAKKRTIELTSSELVLGILAQAPYRGFKESKLGLAIDKSSREFPELSEINRPTGTDGSTPSDGETRLGTILAFAQMGRLVFTTGDYQYDYMPTGIAKVVNDRLAENHGRAVISYMRRMASTVLEYYKRISSAS